MGVLPKLSGRWVPLGHRIGPGCHPDSEFFKCPCCGHEQYVLYDDPPDRCQICKAALSVDSPTRTPRAIRTPEDLRPPIETRED